MKLIVGLGNPGKEYINTKHNIGFSFIDYFCYQNNINLTNSKFNGIFNKVKINNQDIIIAKPMTYMNLSGEFVLKLIDYYKIETNNILVIHDDLDTQIGSFKIKQSGSSGGQNGLKNIINLLKTEKIKRIKIGIGRPTNKNFPISEYVLSKFTNEEKNKVYDNFNKITECIAYFIDDNLLKAMNKYN